MVAPLVAAGGRVISSKVVKNTTTSNFSKTTGNIKGLENTGRRMNAIIEKPGLVRRSDRKKKMQERTDNPISDTNRQELYRNSRQNIQNIRDLKQSGALPKLNSVNRIKAVVASSFIFWTVIWFWIPQFAFSMFGIAAIGIEALPLVRYVVPGTVIWGGMYVIVAFIGISTMIYATAIYLGRAVNAFSGMKGLVFAFCVAGYLTPFLNTFPWIVVWLWTVIYMQKAKNN